MPSTPSLVQLISALNASSALHARRNRAPRTPVVALHPPGLTIRHRPPPPPLPRNAVPLHEPLETANHAPRHIALVNAIDHTLRQRMVELEIATISVQYIGTGYRALIDPVLVFGRECDGEPRPLTHFDPLHRDYRPTDTTVCIAHVESLRSYRWIATALPNAAAWLAQTYSHPAPDDPYAATQDHAGRITWTAYRGEHVVLNATRWRPSAPATSTDVRTHCQAPDLIA